ncbi:T9SS type A sorting domain-containing protein [Algoriphagus taiwanensis]
MIFFGDNTFNGNNTFISGGNLDADGSNQFSVPAGTSTSFVKNGNGNDDWQGGNTFGTVSFTNNSNNRFRLANATGDTFLSTSTFSNNGTNFLGIAFNGTNTFAQQIEINNTNPGGEVRFGEGGGTSTLSTGGVVTSSFAAANLLEFNNFTQVQNSPNGTFNTITFTSVNSSFQGDFTVSATTINFNGANTYARNGTFTAASIQMTNAGNNFATSGGIARFTKTPSGTTNDWNGGNTFGTLEITNNANSRLRLGQNSGDTFNSTSVFTNNGNNILGIAFRGTNSFAQQITINNTNVGGTVRFGEGGGTSTLQAGGVVTNDFSVGNLLEFNNFTQIQNSPNGNFGVSTFNSINSSFQGDFGVTATSSITFQGTNTYARNGNFTALNITANGANNFSTAGGVANFTKTGGGSNDWAGGNTFGVVNFVNNSGSRFRLAVNNGDTFTQNASFVSTSTGFVEPAFNNISTFAGNISTIGSNRALTFGLGNGTVQIVGNNAQFWQGDAANSPIVERLVMSTTGSLTLSVPLLVDISATFTNGIVNSDAANLLTIDNGALASGMSNASHVDGPVQKIGNQAFTFPVGDGGFYAPLIMANRGGGGTDIYTAQYFLIAPVDIPTDTTSRDATIGLMNQSEHWNLERNSGTVNRGISLSYDVSRTAPVVDYTELVSIYWDGTAWRDLGGSISGNDTAGTITAGNTSNRGFLSIGSSFRILPVELLSFTAKQTETRDILIEWKTATEKNNSHFILERSFDGKNWETISLIPGAGDSLEPLSYRHLDTNPQFGRNFYRLTQVDFDGLTTVYQTIAVSLSGEPGNNLQVVVYPNPTQGRIYLESKNQNLDGMQVEILNLNGQSILQSEAIRNSRAEFDLSGLPRGIYILKLYSASEIITQKIILQ